MKSPVIRVTPAADADLDEQFEYIAQDSLEAAIRFLKAARRDFRCLAEMPGMGRLREFTHVRLQTVRSWPIGGFENHLIFYRPIDGGIEVVRVLHGARDIEAIFRK